MCSPSALSGSEVITLAFRLPSVAFPGPESRNFMMVETMLRAVFTMARVLVTMLLQINWTPPDETHTQSVSLRSEHLQGARKDDGRFSFPGLDAERKEKQSESSAQRRVSVWIGLTNPTHIKVAFPSFVTEQI